MALLGGILGVLVGFSVGIVFSEIIFANSASWTDVVPVALAALGALAGASLGRRFGGHRTKTHPPARPPLSH
jgi:TRAP-type C4-dicarboxylate transport system permease small subunit